MKEKRVTTTELINNLAAQFEVTKKMAKDLISHVLTEIEGKLIQGNKIKLDKLGIFQVKERAARKGRNPQTGEEVLIPASKKISFRASKSLKEQVVGKKKTTSKKK
jgi:DNA-binding protein HU-beta